MISKKEYEEAVAQQEVAQQTITQYFQEKQKRFDNRMKTNHIFKDDELVYAATAKCPCGHGLAYPEGCGPSHHWDCSAILKGIANKDVKHTGKMPFMFYSIKSENSERGTTRP